MEVHRQRRGTPRNTLGLRHDGGWIPPGVQAFGDLARQPWSPLDGGKGMYTGEVGRVAWDTLSRMESALRASDGNETRRIPDSITEDTTNNVRDIVLFCARVFYEPCKLGNFDNLFENHAENIDSARSRPEESFDSIILSDSVENFGDFWKVGKCPTSSRTLKIFDRPSLLTLAKFEGVPAAIGNFVVNGADEKLRMHRLESWICAWQWHSTPSLLVIQSHLRLPRVSWERIVW